MRFFRRSENFLTIDGKTESTVTIHGAHVISLYNYLLNNKYDVESVTYLAVICPRSVVSMTGSDAGIPPTILAPVAFEGATLVPLQVFVHSLKRTQCLVLRSRTVLCDLWIPMWPIRIGVNFPDPYYPTMCLH